MKTIIFCALCVILTVSAYGQDAPKFDPIPEGQPYSLQRFESGQMGTPRMKTDSGIWYSDDNGNGVFFIYSSEFLKTLSENVHIRFWVDSISLVNNIYTLKTKQDHLKRLSILPKNTSFKTYDSLATLNRPIGLSMGDGAFGMNHAYSLEELKVKVQAELADVTKQLDAMQTQYSDMIAQSKTNRKR